MAAGFRGIVDWTGIRAGTPVVQHGGLRTWDGSAVIDLLLVDPGDAPIGLGATPMIEAPTGTRAVYLVVTADPNASPLRCETTLGARSIRRKT